jgi:alkanesulfonate monooxygenase SsuD/methylene tetrahydromethanopterin reductase-like flavin-dependent oxidoreductase (luciferase family)
MMRHTAVGDPEQVRHQLVDFAAHAEADELMVLHVPRSIDARLRSLELLAEVAELEPPEAGTPIPAPEAASTADSPA